MRLRRAKRRPPGAGEWEALVQGRRSETGEMELRYHNGAGLVIRRLAFGDKIEFHYVCIEDGTPPSEQPSPQQQQLMRTLVETGENAALLGLREELHGEYEAISAEIVRRLNEDLGRLKD